jgi:hypothetical protein
MFVSVRRPSAEPVPRAARSSRDSSSRLSEPQHRWTRPSETWSSVSRRPCRCTTHASKNSTRSAARRTTTNPPGQRAARPGVWRRAGRPGSSGRSAAEGRGAFAVLGAYRDAAVVGHARGMAGGKGRGLGRSGGRLVGRSVVVTSPRHPPSPDQRGDVFGDFERTRRSR